MLNNLSRRNFYDMFQLIRLEGKHTTKSAHCALVLSREFKNWHLQMRNGLQITRQWLVGS